MLPVSTDIDGSGPPVDPPPGVSVVVTASIEAFIADRHRTLVRRAWHARASQVLVSVYDVHARPQSLYAPLRSDPEYDITTDRVASTFGGALAAALPLARAATLLIVDACIELTPGQIEALAAAVVDDIVIAQPVVRTPDDLIASAGAALPVPTAPFAALLRGFPADDADRLGVHPIMAADEPCVAVRTAACAIPVRTVDLRTTIASWSLGTIARGGGRAICLPLGRVYRTSETRERRYDHEAADALAALATVDDAITPDVLDQAGFAVDRVVSDMPGQPIPLREPRLHLAWSEAALTVREREQRLRWSIKIAAHPGARGDDWGDLFFARDLASALRALGQDVVIDHRESHARVESEHLDDVSLVLRGLDDTPTTVGAINILWVISHPERVTAAELARFDLRYAAGPAWAATASRTSGVRVAPLLQATAPARFSPTGPRSDGLDVVFVGKTRDTVRPIVRDALAAGLDLAVWGEGWAGTLPATVFRGAFLDNALLPEVYRSARVVLNDHWPAMAAGGFISNRIFDATAAGSFVITDPVPGLEQAVGGAAAVYHDVEDLRRLASRAPDPEGTRIARGEAIGAEHSFQRRAERLLEDVRRYRATRG